MNEPVVYDPYRDYQLRLDSEPWCRALETAVDEFSEGIIDGQYISLNEAWAIPSRWEGKLVAFMSEAEKFGVVTRTGNGVWRCYLGELETDGMFGRTWWEECYDVIVEDLAEGIQLVRNHFCSK